jgi:DNA primase
MPIEWAELSDLKSSSAFTMNDVLQILDRKSGRAGGKEVKGQRLPGSSLEKPLRSAPSRR